MATDQTSIITADQLKVGDTFIVTEHDCERLVIVDDLAWYDDCNLVGAIDTQGYEHLLYQNESLAIIPAS